MAGGTLARASAVGHKPRRPARAGQVVLDSSFQLIGGVRGVVASGDYLLSTSAGWSAINQRLGTTTLLDPQCQVIGLGPPWVLMSCPPTSTSPPGPIDVALYSLPDGTRQTVTLSSGMPYCSSPPYDSEVRCSADAVGAYWIEWVAGSYHHLPTEVYFQNIQTGELRDDPTNATTFADLNSPGLAHRTCPGVQLLPNVLSASTRGDGLGFADSLRSIRARRHRRWSFSRAVRDAHAPTADVGIH